MKSTIIAPAQDAVKKLLALRIGTSNANTVVNTAKTNADSVTGTNRTNLQIAYAQMLTALRRK